MVRLGTTLIDHLYLLVMLGTIISVVGCAPVWPPNNTTNGHSHLNAGPFPK